SCVILKIREGKIADKENFTFDKQGSADEVREEFIYRYYTGREDIPKAVVLDKAAADMEMFAEFLRVQCGHNVQAVVPPRGERKKLDRKSTRLNSSHVSISYAVFCLKKKKR